MKFLIIGMGISGCTTAHQLSKQFDSPVIDIVDSRHNVGGNCHIKEIGGTMVPSYGAHIFNTDSESIWGLFKEHCPKWVEYHHKVLSITSTGKRLPIPLSPEALCELFCVDSYTTALYHLNIEIDHYKRKYTIPRNFEEEALAYVGKTIYDEIVYYYTKKQWGMEPSEMAASGIIKRVPIIKGRTYHDKKYSAIGDYTLMCESMIRDSGAYKFMGFDLGYEAIKNSIEEGYHVFFSGSLDKLLDYKHGELEYRTVSFEREILPLNKKPSIQGSSVVNHCSDKNIYTRSHEYHLMDGTLPENSIIEHEIPSTFKNGSIRAYPVRSSTNIEIYNMYLSELKDTFGDMFTPIGRLGTYQYLDMSVAMEKSIEIVNNFYNKIVQSS